MKVSIGIMLVVVVLCSVILAVLGFFVGLTAKRKSDDAKIANATEQATKILNDALSEAEKTKKTQLMEAKDEIHKLRSDADKEIRERRNEVQKQEKRLNQREEYLDKKSATLEKKNESLSEKIKAANDKLLEIDGIKKSQFDMLERISGLSQEDARAQLMS